MPPRQTEEMIIKDLSTTSFEQILHCFLSAFADYYVEMPTDPVYYRQRWRLAKVDFNLSYGMFDRGKLVGFIIHAIDHRQGRLLAFNTGTGVIPDYRGRRIVQTIYNYALRELAHNDVEKITLEVIRKNEKAVRSYESVGFAICKKYQCFAGSIPGISAGQVAVEEIAPGAVDWARLPDQEQYSWDFQRETIVNGNYAFYQVRYNQVAESFFIINPDNHYVAQFDLWTKEVQAWPRLFSAMQQVSERIKVINVDERRVDKLTYLHQIGLVRTVDQFEMALTI